MGYLLPNRGYHGGCLAPPNRLIFLANLLDCAPGCGDAMAEDEHRYLEDCRHKGICPTCRKPLKTRVGSGSFSQGVFCSLKCNAQWHEVALRLRHEGRLKGRNDG